jgi:hypothetical protein
MEKIKRTAGVIIRHAITPIRSITLLVKTNFNIRAMTLPIAKKTAINDARVEMS